MNTSKYPLSVDGERLDQMCWNVSTQSSRRRMSARRPRDVQIAGRHGVVPSTYDDFEANTLALQMWVRGSDSDGRGNDRMLYDRNMDKLFRIFGRNDGLLDIRQTMDPDRMTTQYNFTRNPRLTTSSGNTVLRTNYVPNPSMEGLISVLPFRTNLITNPVMRTSTSGWVAPGSWVTMDWVPYGIGGVGRLTRTDDGLFEAYSTPFAVTAGLPYAAQCAMRNIDAAVRGYVGFVWYTGAGGTGTLTRDIGPSQDIVFRTGWSRPEYVSIPPAGTLSARLVVGSDVSFIDNSRFDFYQAIVEQTDLVSDYFDGDSKPDAWRIGYRWTGTPHASTSQEYYKPLQNWSSQPAGTSGDVFNIADQPGEFVWTSTVLRVETINDIDTGRLLLNQSSRPTTTAGQPWSGRISLRGVPNVSVGKVVRVGIYASDGANANMGPILSVEHTLADGWREVVIDNAIAPAGVASVGWKAESLDEWQAGQYFFVDAASLEHVSESGPFFAGGMANVRWAGTANASNSEELGGNIANWTPIRGTLSKSYNPLYTPVPFDTSGVGMYTATDITVANGNQITMDYANFSDNPELKLGIPYTASVYVTGPGRAKVQLVVANASNTTLWSSDSNPVDIVDGWTRLSVTDTPNTDLTTAAKIRMTVYFYGPAGQPGANDEFFATAAQLELGGMSDWFDGNFPGATWDGQYSRMLPAVRQVWGKVTDAIDTSMFAVNAADIGVAITLPYVFWSDTDNLVWYSDPVGSTGTTVKYEVSNLRGSTAPIDDAIIIVNGPATNPRVTCSKTGAYIQYNGILTSSQAWRIDVGRYLSGTGPKALDWESPAWTDQMKRTYYTGSRNRLLTLVPEGEDGEVYLSFSNCDSAKVRARRKFH